MVSVFQIFWLKILSKYLQESSFLVTAYNFTNNGLLHRYCPNNFDRTGNITGNLLKSPKFYKNIFDGRLRRETGHEQDIMCFKISTFLKLQR